MFWVEILCLWSCAGLTGSESEVKLAQSCQSAPTTLVTGTTERSSTRDVALQTSETDMMRRATVAETVWTLAEPATPTATEEDTRQTPRRVVTEDEGASDADETLRSSERATVASAAGESSAVESRSVDEYSTAVRLVAVSVQLVPICLSRDAVDQCSEVTATEHEDDHAAPVSATEDDTQHAPRRATSDDEDVARVTDTGKLLYATEPMISTSATETVQSSYTAVAVCSDADADDERSLEDTQRAPTQATAEVEHATAVGDTDRLLYATERTVSATAIETASVVESDSLDELSTTVHLSHTVAAAVCRDADADEQCTGVAITTHEQHSAASVSEEDTQRAPTQAATKDEDSAAVSDAGKLPHPTEPTTSASSTETASSVVESRSHDDAVSADASVEDQRSRVINTKHLADDKDETLLATLNRKMTTDKLGDITDRSSSPFATASNVRTACTADKASKITVMFYFCAVLTNQLFVTK